MRQIKAIADLMGGAVSERFKVALDDVLRNIHDPNTDAKKKREITIKLTISPSKDRSTADFSLNVRPTLAPPMTLSSTVMITRDDSGNVTATEIGDQLPGQTEMPEAAEPLPNVVKFNAQK